MPVIQSLRGLRSLLFVPALSVQLLSRAPERGADALIVDLEDAVPLERKAEARPLAARAIEALADRALVLLRINAEPALWKADIEAVPLHLLSGVMLPKVTSSHEVRALADALTLVRRLPAGHSPPPVVALVETASGVVEAAQIARTVAAVSQGGGAMGFGSEDYAAEMGVSPAPASLLWPAQQVATCARAAGLPCWGLPGSVAEIADVDAFGALAASARAIGMTGTVCVHPRQIQAANEGFGPTTRELAWAQRVVEADEAARAKGLGVVQIEGRMIDRPIVDRARRWLARAWS